MSYLYDSHYNTNSTEFLAIYFPFIVQYYHHEQRSGGSRGKHDSAALRMVRAELLLTNTALRMARAEL